MCFSVRHFCAVLMLAMTSTAMATDSSPWPAVPSRLTLETPYGDLRVSSSDYVYESRLMLDGIEIQPLTKGLLNIPYAFSSPDFHVALVSINTGDPVCAVTYRWIMLNDAGYTTTPRFGSCSESINVSARGATFTLVTPSIDNPAELDHYLYDGKSVTKKTGVNTRPGRIGNRP